MDENRLLIKNDPSIPTSCSKCGGGLDYNGLGSYKCKECGFISYDDYGTVRNYLDLHPGATVHEVALATGVSQGKIRQMVREEKFEISQNSGIFLRCEMCGADIRSGRFCDTCAKKALAKESNADKRSTAGSVQGFGRMSASASGSRRFSRD